MKISYKPRLSGLCSIYGSKHRYNVQLRTGVRVFGRQSAQGNVFVEANWIHNTKKQGVISEAETYYVDGTRNAGEGRIGWEGNITKN